MATAEKRKHTESTDTHSSNIWDSFIKNPTDGSKATCRKCRKVVSHGKSNAKSKSWGNGPLWNHFKTCSPVIPKWDKLHYRHVEMRRAKPGIHDGHWVVEDDQLKCFMVKNALLVVEEFLDSAHAYNIRKSVGIKNIYSMWYSGIVTELIKLIFIELIEVGLCLFCNTINTFK